MDMRPHPFVWAAASALVGSSLLAVYALGHTSSASRPDLPELPTKERHAPRALATPAPQEVAASPAPPPAPATTPTPVLSGVIRHAFGGPVAGARLSLRPLDDQRARPRSAAEPAPQRASAPVRETKSDGRFALDAELGEHELLVQAEGFRPLVRRVQVQGDTRLELVLELRPMLLGALGQSGDDRDGCRGRRVKLEERRPDRLLRTALRAHSEHAQSGEEVDTPGCGGGARPDDGDEDESGHEDESEAESDADDLSDLNDGPGPRQVSWAHLDAECRFSRLLSGAAAEVHVSVWATDEQALVSIPPTGDPTPICLGRGCAPSALLIAWFVSEGGKTAERFLLQGGSLMIENEGSGWGSSHAYPAPAWEDLQITAPGPATLTMGWHRAGRKRSGGAPRGELREQLLLRPGINDVVLRLGR
jgi:hypothetical protein